MKKKKKIIVNNSCGLIVNLSVVRMR